MNHNKMIKMVRAAMCSVVIVGVTLHVAAQQFGVGTAQSALTLQPGVMTTLAGNGVSGHAGDGGPATSAELTNGIRGIAGDAAGDVFFVDDTNDTVRVVYEGGATAAQIITAENPSVTSPQVGYIYVLAGGEGTAGTPSNGTLGSNARLKAGAGLAIDAAGDVYFNDTGTNKVWIIYAGGTGTTGTNLIALEAGVTAPQLGYIYAVAGGSSTLGYTGSGVLATSSSVEFHGINDMKFDATGNMYIVDQGNCAIREVSVANGYLNTIVGNGTCAVQSNNGPASSTELDQPYGIAIDASGNLYIADKGSVNEIRMVYVGGSTAATLVILENPSISAPTVGYIYNIAGGGRATYPFGGLATSSKLGGPTMVALDAAGSLYINDSSLVDQVNPLTGVMSVIAGSSTMGYAGDGGSALAAEMNGTRSVAVDAGGRVYITDATNLRIREVSQGIVLFPGQAANTTSSPQTIELSNTGNSALNFTGGSPIFGGTNPSNFSLDPSASSNTCNLNPLQPATSCTLAITYSPSSSGSSSAATLSYTTNGIVSPQQIVLQGLALPATTITLQASSQNVVDGAAVTFAATVSGVANPTGTVTFSNGSTVLGSATLSSAVATLNYTTATTGTLAVTATYTGNTTTAGSVSNVVSVNVTGSATSTTALLASPTTVNSGQSVMLTANITGSGPTPTGTVVFTDGSTTLGTTTLNASGITTFSTSTLPQGTNNIEAFYAGDTNYSISSSSASVQVYGVPTAVLSVPSGVIVQGQSEILSLTVTGGAVTPTGTVTFYNGTTVLGTSPLTSGTATLSTTALPVGANSLTAAYSGNSSYTANTSNAVPVTVIAQNVAFVFQPGIMTTLAGNGISGDIGDGGLATSAEVTNGLRGIAADAAGDVFFIDDSNYTVRVVYEGGTIAAQLISAENPSVTSPQIGYVYDLAGIEGASGTPSSGILGTIARLKPGAGLSLDASGDIYFNDTGTNRVWIIYAGGSGTTATNLISLEAGVTAPQLGYIYAIAGGSSTLGYSGNGVLATSSGVEFHGINDMKFDLAGNMYIVDQGNCAIREISASTGYLNTIVGNGTCAVQANNGPASSTELDQPYGLAIDPNGNLYIADRGSVNEIRVVYAGGGATATLITLENPTITSPTVGYIYNVAGGGRTTYPFGGLATSSKLNTPTMVALDPAGDVYIADSSVVEEVNPITGLLTVIAGTPTSGYAGDGGSALSAEMNGIRCMTVDVAGRVYVTDAANLRVREISQGIVVFPGQATNTTSSPQMIQLTNAGNFPLTFSGSPTFGGANANDFALDSASPPNTCNLTALQPAASCTLAITYTPTNSGSSSATLSYTTNSILSPQQITLLGLVLPVTTTTLQSSSQSVVNGTSVTFTASVTGVTGPTGTVTFSNGSVVLGIATLSSGVATLDYTRTATGTLAVTAAYAGTANIAGSTSNAVSVNVTGSATSSTVLTPSVTTINQGQNIMLAVTVTGSGHVPTGNVVFTDGSVSLGAVPLNASGSAMLSTTGLTIGPNGVQALYLGDATYASSSSVTTVQVYGVPAITLSALYLVINQGLTETLTVPVTGNGVTPTGTITFYNGSTVIGSGILASGTATLSTTTLPSGANNLTAVYGGDSNYTAGTSTPISVTVNVESVAFVHPGGWLSASDINRIRSAVANQTAPYYAAYLALPSSPNTGFTPSPGAEVTVGSVNNVTYTRLQNDSKNMWLLAVQWVATGNQAYATTLCNSIDGWSATLTTIDGTDAALRAGILGGNLAQAAEICAYANPAWPNKPRAQNMIRLFAQIGRDFAQSSVPNGNWETASANGNIAMAIFLDDRELFNRSVNYLLFGQGNGRISNYVINAAGQVQESGRDQTHSVDGIDNIAEAAQDAWHQGVDLYGAFNNRLLAGFEYTGGYLVGTTPAFVPNRDAWDNPLNSFYTLSNASTIANVGGLWEMVYNHYANLQGLNTPNTAAVVNSPGYIPEPVTYNDIGPGTLLFTRSPGDTDSVTSAPVAPIILSSYGTPSGIQLEWVGSVGATAYNIQRSTTSGGPYSTVATVNGESTYSYTDTTASSPGTPYYYIVTASNSYGQSGPGAEARASAGLPAPWANGDLGTLGANGAGGSDYLGASTFALRASGATVGNSSTAIYYNESNTSYFAIARAVTPTIDSMQFAYVTMTGDGQVVARVNAPLSPVTSSAGLMMRGSLNSDDVMIANMVQYNGLASATSRTAPGVAAVTTGPLSISTTSTAPSDSSSLLVAPYWVQLTRSGNTFTASVSTDDVNWTQVSQQTLSMPATIYAGLTLASGNTTLSTSATFDEVSVPGWTPSPTVPAAPANLTVTAAKGVQLTWGTAVAATSYTIQRNGVNIANIAAPVAGLYASLPGTMYYVDYAATPSSTNTYVVSATGAGGTGSLSATATAVAPAITAPFLTDSVAVPYVVGTVGVPLMYQVGLAGTGIFNASGLPGGLSIDPNTGIISGAPTQGGSYSPVITATNPAGLDTWTYTFTIAGAPLPAGMQQVDLGFLQAPGIAGTNGSTIVNTGTGPGTGTVCDGVHFAYYQLTGDGSITVNLNSVSTASPTTTLSQTGIMVRNTLTCDSLMMEARAGIGGGTTLDGAYRSAANSGAFDYLNDKVLQSASLTLPAYLQITRSGSTFTSFYSTDGINWNTITSQTIGMNPIIYVGLDVAPADTGVANPSTGTYGNLAITSTSPSLINSPSSASGTVGTPFSFTVTSAIAPATFSATMLPSGLNLNSITGVISGTPTTTGTYTVTVSAVNGVASGSASLVITIGDATASVTLGGLSQIYDGSPQSASITTSPAGLAIQVTYDGAITAPIGAGSYSVVATVNDPNYSGTASGTLVIAQASASVSLDDLAQTYTGSALIATATATPSGLSVGLTYNGSATPPTTTGSYTVIAKINDPDYTGSISGTLVIAKASTALSFSTNPATPVVGTGYTLSATATGPGQTGGTVLFSSGASTLCSATLNAFGVASCSFTPSTNGNLAVTAQYQGDTNHLTSAATTTLFVYNPSVVLQLAGNPLVYPGATNVTICVAPATSATATGSVQVYDGTALLTTQSLQGNGCAYWYISPGLSAATHSLTAAYTGDHNNPAGTSVPVTVSVSPAPVSMSASCWNASFSYGGTYQCSVNLSSTAGSPRGSLSYAVDGGGISSVTISNRSAPFSIPTPNAGNHSVSISFAAQGNFAAAGPVTESFTVGQAPTQIQLTPSSYYQSASSPLTLTASLTSWNAGTPTDGTVAFYGGTKLLGTAPAGATVTFNVTGMTTGTQAFSAAYSPGPSTNYASVTSATVNVQLH
jgi:hypothetical protein